MMEIIFLMLIGIVLAVGFVVYLIIASHNRLVALDARCDTAFSDIDAHLKHRQTLIPGLVETVRGFAGHEREILNNVTSARSAALAAASPGSKLDSEGLLSKTIVSLMSVAERYPELKASSHFNELRAEFVATENRITAARRFYNLAIEEYNATLRQFPGNYVGSVRRLSTRRPFDLGIERAMIDDAVAFKF
jgi:LemA protein